MKALRGWLLVPLIVFSVALLGASECELESSDSGQDGSARVVPGAPGMSAQAGDFLIFLNEIVDPWLSDEPWQSDWLSDPGKRFVAFDMTVMNTTDGTHYFWLSDFKLSDAAGFAYEYSPFGPEPALSGINLDSGLKTRGWVTFEVNVGTSLKALKYLDIEFRFDASARQEAGGTYLAEDNITLGDEAVLRDTFIQGGLEADWTYDEAACIYDVLRSHYPLDALRPFVEGTGDVEAFVDEAFARYRPEIGACRL